MYALAIASRLRLVSSWIDVYMYHLIHVLLLVNRIRCIDRMVLTKLRRPTFSVNQWNVPVGLSETSQSASETKSTFIGSVVRRGGGGGTGNHILNADEKPRTCALLIAY